MTRWPDLPTSPIYDEVTLPRRATTILRSDSNAGTTEKLLEKYSKTHHLQIWDQRWEQGRRGREESGSGGTFLSSNYCPRTRHIHHLNPNICIQMELNLHQMRHILDNMMRRKQKNVCVCCVYVWICVCICCVCVPIAGSRSCIGRIKAPAGVRLHVCHRCMFSIFYWPSTQALGHILF